MIEPFLNKSIAEWSSLIPLISQLSPQLQKLAEAVQAAWSSGGKVLIAGNGGSAADAMHLAEELTVRFDRNRRALAAISLTDATAVTCAANDLGYENIFSRQIEALGDAGDVFIAFSTSGNSPNIIRALKVANDGALVTVAFLGKGGGKAKDLADIELVIPSDNTARIQEAHQLLFHTLCAWIDESVE